MKETTGTRLKRIMNERGLKQIDILKKCEPYCEKYNIKLAKNDLSQYINDKVQPRQDKLSILAMALGVSEVYLMGYDDDTPAASSAAVPDLRAYSEKEKKFIDVYLGLSQEDKDFLEKMMFRMAPDAKNDSGD